MELVHRRAGLRELDGRHTGNNDVTFRDCNGALVDLPRERDVRFATARRLRDIGIKPY